MTRSCMWHHVVMETSRDFNEQWRSVCGLIFARARTLSTTFSALVSWANQRQSHQQACQLTDWCKTKNEKRQTLAQECSEARDRLQTNTKSLLLHSRDKTGLNTRLKCVNKLKCTQKRSYGSHSPTVYFRQIIGIDVARFHGLFFFKKKNLGALLSSWRQRHRQTQKQFK